MKIPLSWLKEFLKTDAKLEEIATTLTGIGLEVESIHDNARELASFTVAYIIEAVSHPNADKLRVCTVNTGTETLQIVCGASNARSGIYVVLAPVGSVIPANGMTIKRSAIRGVESHGMLCSAEELGVKGDAQGIIELHATQEDIGTSYMAFAGLDDPVIEIAVTPNRGDCLSIYGVARDLAAAGLGVLKPIQMPVIASKEICPVTIKNEAPEVCPRLVGRYFRGVRNGVSPAWLVKRLQSVGVEPVSALVDITSYMTFAFGRPLHVYDADMLEGALTVRYAKEGETIEALNHKSYTLAPDMLVVADSRAPQAIAGIIGGKASGCREDTTNVLLEVALFDPAVVAYTGRKLDIVTDSRYRFERSVDPAWVEDALAVASQLIIEHCGGSPSQAMSAGEQTHTPHVILFDPKAVQTLTGLDVPAEKIVHILTTLGFTTQGSGNLFAVPSWRPDVREVADVVEEVVRITGYDHIPSTPLRYVMHQAILPQKDVRRNLARHMLASIGMTECVTWSFMLKERAALFGAVNPLVTLINPISRDLNQLRPSILPNLLEAAVRNATRGYLDIALFEAGPVYHDLEQSSSITGVRTGYAVPRNVHGAARTVDVFDSKADALSVLEVCGISPDALRVVREAPDYYHPGRSGAFMLGKIPLAYFGELHPSITKIFDLSVPVVGFEIMPDKLVSAKVKNHLLRKALVLSDYQHSIRDFAFIVDEHISAESLVRSIQKVDQRCIEEVVVFDVYQGKHMEAGKKSIAISVRLRAQDHTLREEELTLLSSKIIEVVGKQGGVLR